MAAVHKGEGVKTEHQDDSTEQHGGQDEIDQDCEGERKTSLMVQRRKRQPRLRKVRTKTTIQRRTCCRIARNWESGPAGQGGAISVAGTIERFISFIDLIAWSGLTKMSPVDLQDILQRPDQNGRSDGEVRQKSRGGPGFSPNPYR